MRIQHEKVVSDSFDVVLSPYIDYKHIEHVHPETLGNTAY